MNRSDFRNQILQHHLIKRLEFLKEENMQLLELLELLPTVLKEKNVKIDSLARAAKRIKVHRANDLGISINETKAMIKILKGGKRDGRG